MRVLSLQDFAVTFTLSSAPSSSVNSTTTAGGEQGDGGHGHRAPHWDTVDADGNIPVTDGAFLLPVPGINTSLRVHLDLQQGNQSVTATLTGFVAASGGNVLGAATLADLVPTILQLGSQWAATVGKHEQTLVITSAPVLAASFIIRASAPVTAGNALTRLTTAVDAGALGAAITKASPAATPAGITFAQNPTAPVRVLVPITLSAGANGTAGDFNASSLGGAPGSQVAVIATTSFTLNVTTAGGANASAIAGAVQQGVSDSLHVPPDAVDVTVAPSTPADNSSSPYTGAVTSVVTVTVQHGSIGDITLPGNSSDALAPSAAPAGADGGINSTATTPDATSTPTAVPVTASSESTVTAPAGNSTDAAAAPAAPAAAPVANLTAFTASVQDIIQNTVPQAVQAALAADNVANATVQAPTSADGISTSASAAVPLAGSDVSAAAQVASTQQRSGAGGGSPISTPSAPPPSVPPPPAGLLVASTLPHSGATTPACGVAAVLAVLTAVVGAAM